MATSSKTASQASALARATAPVSAALDRLSTRERQAVLVAAWTVGLGLLWWLAIAPAWTTLREAPARHARLDAQLGQMQGMAATAGALRSETNAQPPGRDEVLRATAQALELPEDVVPSDEDLEAQMKAAADAEAEKMAALEAELADAKARNESLEARLAALEASEGRGKKRA